MSSGADDVLLCPVRAWEEWLLRRCAFADNGYLWPWPQAKLDKFFVKLVKDSCVFEGVDCPRNVGMHGVRKLAASHSQHIMRAGSEDDKVLLAKLMGFKSPIVLYRSYVFPVLPLETPFVVPFGTTSSV